RHVAVEVVRRVHAEGVAPVALADPDRRARTVRRRPERRIAAERRVQELARLVFREEVAIEVVRDVELADVEADAGIGRLQSHPRLAEEKALLVALEPLRLGVDA